MSLYCAVSKTYRDIGRISPFAPTPSLFGATVGGDPLGVGVDHIGVLPTSLVSENWSTWAIVWHCLHNHKFSRFDTILACDRRDTGATAYTALT